MTEIKARFTGIPYTASAMTNAEISATTADIQAGLRRTPSMIKRTTIGMAATTADPPRLPLNGS
jgi:hypothetical protein